MFAEVQFSSNLNDESDTSIFTKEAAFDLKYKAVASESKRNVRVFSPFPKLPDIILTAADSLVAHRGNSDTVAGLNTVRWCRTAASENAYEFF